MTARIASTRRRTAALATATLALLAASAPTLAQSLQPSPRSPGLYVQYGRAGGSTDALTLGTTIPWNWSAMNGALTGYFDLYASHWRIDGPGGSNHALTQVGVLPALRWRFDQGRSPWFAEASTLGLTVTDTLYDPPGKRFSTRFNFASHVGVGYSFGTGKRQELGLRVQHISNAGIKKPNPGENFLQLRYGVSF